ISATGSMLYTSGSAAGNNAELVWVSRDGKTTAVDSRFVRYLTVRVRLSPDGRQAAFIQADGSGRRQTWVKQLDRGPATRIFSGAFPAWSPDGKQLLSGTLSGMIVTPADGSRSATTFRLDGKLTMYPDWSKDGRWRVYVEGDNIYGLHDQDSIPV